MGIDASEFSLAIAPAIPPVDLDGRRVIAYLGALGRARDPGFILDAFRCLRESDAAAFLLLIGDAPSDEEKAWLRSLIKASGLEKSVYLTGWLSRADALRMLRLADVAWSPIPRGTLYDVSSPTKVLEYLALGIPCVASDIPDQKYVVDQSGGGECVELSVRGFAEASLRLLRDDIGARAMGSSGREWVIRHREYSVLASEVAAAYWRTIGAADV